MKKALHIFILILILFLSACSDNSGIALTSVRVDSGPLDFLAGQSLSLDGATIIASTSIGDKIVSTDDIVFDAHTFSSEEIGKSQKFTCSYLGIPFTLDVNVFDVENATAEIIASSKTYYQYASERGVYDNSFDKDTCRFTATYGGGKTKVLNNEDYEVIFFDDATSAMGYLTLRTKVGTKPFISHLTFAIAVDKATSINVDTASPVEHTTYDPNNPPIKINSVIRESGFVDDNVDESKFKITSDNFYQPVSGGGYEYNSSGSYVVTVTYYDSESGETINYDATLHIEAATTAEGV